MFAVFTIWFDTCYEITTKIDKKSEKTNIVNYSSLVGKSPGQQDQEKQKQNHFAGHLEKGCGNGKTCSDFKMNAISNGLKKNWLQNDFNSSSSNSSCESERWVCIETTPYQKVSISNKWKLRIKIKKD